MTRYVDGIARVPKLAIERSKGTGPYRKIITIEGQPISGWILVTGEWQEKIKGQWVTIMSRGAYKEHDKLTIEITTTQRYKPLTENQEK